MYINETEDGYETIYGVLRSEWGFEGLVMSDWGAQGELALRPVAGNDLNMPGSGKKYIELLRGGEIDIAAVQACAVRVMKLLLKTSEKGKSETLSGGLL